MSALSDLISRCHANPAPLSDWEASFLAEAAEWRRSPTPRQIALLERIANRIAPSEIALMLAERMEDLAMALQGDPPTYRHGNQIRYGNHLSLSIEVRGQKRGTWCDHSNDKKGGDALGLVAYLRGQGQADAVRWAKRFLGIGDGDGEPLPVAPPRVSKPEPEAKSTLPFARAIWGEAVPAERTLVERYLVSRGLTLPRSAPLRFHPACRRAEERLPAMVALMTDPVTAEPVGVHRTFLRSDGSGKADGQAKMMLGGSGVIRLSADTEVTTGLGLAEGIETALAILQTGWSPVWAAGNAGAISAFPVLPGIEALTIFADHDANGVGTRAARACAERWVAAGREVVVRTPPAGLDWNDVVRRAA
jgi:putative DNA primase/helicase